MSGPAERRSGISRNHQTSCSKMMRPRSQQPIVCHGHTRPIVDLQFSGVTPDGYFLVSASKDGQPMLRNGLNGDWIGTFLGHKGAVWACALDPSATIAVTASADFSAKIWDALTGLERASLPHSHIVRTAAFSPDSARLVTGGHEKILRVFDVDRPDAPTELATAAGPIRALACLGGGSSGGLVLGTVSDMPGVPLWDARAGGLVRTLPTAGAVTAIDLTHDGRWLTTTDGGNTITVWDTTAPDAPVHVQRVPYAAEAASYCPARNRFAVGGEDMWVHVHAADSGLELEVNKGHHGPVHTVRFGPEGKEYASGSEDGTIRIWQTDGTAAESGEAAGTGSGGGAAAVPGAHATVLPTNGAAAVRA